MVSELTGVSGGDEQSKAKVFISYSRRDLQFADSVDAALKARGFDTLIDRTEIYALEDWWKRVEALISQADTIVFILSPDAVASEICQSEVRFAASLNKRLAPIVWRRVDDKAVPSELARLNFIFFDGPEPFEASLDRLAEALETDIEWVRKHTEFGEHARRWMIAGRPGPRGLLLRPPALDEAERWIASRPHNAPLPTEAAQAFITMSRQAHTRRRNIFSGGLAAGLFVALGLAGLAYWQRGVAVEQEKIATEQRQVALVQKRIAEDQRGIAVRSTDHATAAAVQEFETQGQGALAGNIALAAMPLASDEATTSERPLTTAALARAIRRDHEVLRGYADDNVLRAVATKDGKTLVTGLSNGHIQIWSLPDLKLQHDIEAQDDYPTVLQISPDQSAVLVAGAKVPTVWELSSGQKRFDLAIPNPKKFVGAAQWSPDGEMIAVGAADNRLMLFTAAGGSLVHEINGPDFKTLIARVKARTEGNFGVDLGDPIAEAVASSIFQMNGVMTQLAFSPDGKTVAVSGAADPEAAVRFYDVNSGTLRATAVGPQYTTFSTGRLLGDALAYDAEGERVAAIAGEHNIQIYDSDRGRLLQTLAANNTQSLLFTRDGAAVVSAHRDGSIILWCALSGRQVIALHAHRGNIEHLSFNDDQTLFAASSDDHTSSIWPMPGSGALCQDKRDEVLARLQALQPIARLEGDTDIVWRTLFLPDGKLLTTSRDLTLRQWRLAERGESQIAVPSVNGTDLGGQPKLRSVFDRSGKFILVQRADTQPEHVEVWSASPPQMLASVVGARIASSLPEGKVRIYKSPFEVVLFEPGQGIPAPGQEADPLSAFEHLQSAWDVSSDGSRAVGARSSFIKQSDDEVAPLLPLNPMVLVDLTTLKEVTELTVEGYVPYEYWSGGSTSTGAGGVLFSADGTRVLGVMKRGGKPEHSEPESTSLAVWDAKTGELLARSANFSDIVAIKASDDGQTLYLEVSEPSDRGTSKFLHLYRLKDGTLIEVKKPTGGTSAPLPSSAWTVSPDGRFAATGNEEGGVRVWNVGDGSVVADLSVGSHEIDALALSPDGRFLAAADASRTLRLIELATGAIVAAPVFRSATESLRFDPTGNRVAAQLVTGDVELIEVAPLSGVSTDGVAYADWLRASQLIYMSPSERQKLQLTAPALVDRPDLDALKPEIASLPQRAARPAEAARCDEAAADPQDREKPAPGVTFSKLDGAAAVSACDAGLAAAPDDPTLLYEKGRALNRLGDSKGAAEMLKKAADQGYGAAARLLALLIDGDPAIAAAYGSSQRLWEEAAAMGDASGVIMIGSQRALNAQTADEFTAAIALAKYARPDRLSADILLMADAANKRVESPQSHTRILFLYLLGIWIADNVKQVGLPENSTYRASVAARVQVLSREFEPSALIALWRSARGWNPAASPPLGVP